MIKIQLLRICSHVEHILKCLNSERLYVLLRSVRLGKILVTFAILVTFVVRIQTFAIDGIVESVTVSKNTRKHTKPYPVHIKRAGGVRFPTALWRPTRGSPAVPAASEATSAPLFVNRRLAEGVLRMLLVDDAAALLALALTARERGPTRTLSVVTFFLQPPRPM